MEDKEITKAEPLEITYDAGGTEVSLNEQVIRSYVCNGREDVPEAEIAKFAFLCQARRLNPFVDVVPTVYGNGSKAKISIVTTKDYHVRLANSHPDFDGMDAGIIVMAPDGSAIEKRKGSMVPPGWVLVGGWAEVYRKSWSHSSYDEVSLAEYDQGQSLWLSKPATMIRKVAVDHALREAFSAELGGVYGEEEMPVVEAVSVDD